MTKERYLLEKAIMQLSIFDLEKGAALIREIQQLLAQPEQTEQKPAPITFKDDADKIAHLENSVELLSSLLDARKPLTPQQISEGNQSMLNVTREAFVKGVKFAETMHGITGGVE